jgi:hypothetical protein
MTPPRQRLVNHCPKTGIAADTDVNLLGNGRQTPVSAATDINKGIPVATDRVTKDMYSVLSRLQKGSSFLEELELDL